MAKEPGKFLQPINWILKAEMKTLQIGWSVVSFLGVLPLLDSETSGRKPNGFERAWKKGFDFCQKVAARAQVGQAMFFRKLNLIDSTFAGKIYDAYSHELRDSGGSKVDYIIGLNKKGFLNEIDTARLLGEGTAGGAAVYYNPAKRIFEFVLNASDELIQRQKQITEAAISWANEKAPQMLTTGKEADQKDFAAYITRVYQNMRVDTGPQGTEGEIFALSPRSFDGHLCGVFNIRAEKEKRYASFYGKTVPVEEAIRHFSDDMKDRLGYVDQHIASCQPRADKQPTAEDSETLKKLKAQRDTRAAAGQAQIDFLKRYL